MTEHEARPLSPCGCCETASREPERSNRPGLPALDYRIGTHGSFLQRMLSRLHSAKIADGEHKGSAPLATINARSENEPLGALLDAWASTADVLTFYQERIANECFLRTATERRSVLELARSIGYELSPGVAASTYLAFTIDDDPGTATIPEGTQIQSIPERGELPQTFETSEDLEARSSWNEIHPRMTEPQVLTPEMVEAKTITLRLAGIGLDLEPGDRFVAICYDDEADEKMKALAAFGITTVEEVADEDVTIVDGENLGVQLDVPEQSEEATIIAAAEVNTDLDLDVDLSLDLNITYKFDPYSWKPSIDTVDFTAAEPVAGYGGLFVDGTLDLQRYGMIARSNRWTFEEVVASGEALRDASWKPRGEVHVFRERVGFFGHNAPKWKSLPIEQKKTGVKIGEQTAEPAYPMPWDGSFPPTIWQKSQWSTALERRPLYYETHGPFAFLERVVEGIVEGSWTLVETVESVSDKDNPKVHASVPHRRLAIVTDVSEETLADYGLSSKCTGLRFGLAPKDVSGFSNIWKFLVRTTTAHVRSEKLELAPEKPLSLQDDGPGGISYDKETTKGSGSLTIRGVFPLLQEGQVVSLTGTCLDPIGVERSETRELTSGCRIDETYGWTLLRFASSVENDFDRATVRVNANVVAATHGETVSQVLGSGNGAIPNQVFKLLKPPLTYTPSPTPSGAETSLEVRVDGVLWDEIPFFFGAGGSANTYTVRIDNDARAHVIFGDGRRGARLPSGSENISAIYRSGIGLGGHLDSGRLSLLRSKPPGVREVTNPVPAAGAENPETLDFARESAPLRVKTLDRVVSVQDYEDFARTYAGVGKAKASVIWSGSEEVVHLTVGSAEGDTTSAKLNGELRVALDGARDPRETVVVASYDPVPFRITAKVRIDAAYLWEIVRADIEGLLLGTFAFAARAFAQPVTAAEVVAAVHRVPGVIAVDLDELHAFDKKAKRIGDLRNEVLRADRARYSRAEKRILPAQLLTLSPGALSITEMKR